MREDLRSWREARTATMAATDRVFRRRQRSTSSRDSPEEGRQMELQETVRLRDRAAKRGQNREFSNRQKRKKFDRFANWSNRDGEDSTEESVGDGDEEYVAENGGVSRTLPQNTTPFSNHNFRKSARFVKQACKGGDEMMGVTVPRKARSASAKRSHENWVSGYGGGSGGEEQNLRQRSNSPSSSNVSVRKKMKPNGPKTRPTKASKLSSSIQDDIEIEIAEVLYGLMKQSQSSKEPETTESSSQNDGPEPDPLLVLERKKVEAKNISTANQTQNSSISPAKMELSSAELEKIPELTAEKCEASMETQQEGLKPVIKDSGNGDEVAISEKPVSLKEELASSAKLDVDIQDSTTINAISNVSEVENQKEDQFKIDLMLLPSMASPPKRDCLIDLVSDAKHKMETSVKDERVAEEEAGVEEHEKKMESIGEKCKLQKLDSEKLGQDGEIDSDSKLQHKAAIIPKEEKIAQSSTLTLPVAVAGWPGSLPPLGFMPPFQTVASMDGNTGSSMAQHRPKRCATHQYIAHNIYLHQQFSKMNQFWPEGAASAAVYGAKPCNLNFMPATNQLYGNFPSLNLKSKEDKGPPVANCPDRNRKDQSSKASKGPAAATFPGRSGEDQSSKASELMDTAQRKHLVFQQAPQPVPPGSLKHGPAFVVPLIQHQSRPKSATSTDIQSLSSKSVAGVSSSVLPAVATAVSFNYPNLAANEAPYLAILQNNGYPFPISTVGPTPAIRGTPDQAMPFFNGYFYPSQMFQASQLQQQQPQSQSLVQPAHQNTGTSNGSSSSQKQPETQQPRVLQVSGTNFLTSTSMQQSQQQRVPESLKYRKREIEMGGKNTPSVADTRTSHSQKGVNGQELQLNFALTPSATLGGAGGSGNHGEKQPRNSKGGVDLIPPQVFSMSFASLNGNNTASSLNFSTMAQNTAIFQGLPDLAQQVYQFAPAAQVAEQKNNQISERKTGGNSTNLEDGRKTISGKMPTSIGQTLVFDNSAKSLSFMSSTVMGNSCSSSISPTVNVTTSQQQQLLQLQKQHILQQQQQGTGAGRSKAFTTDSQPSSSIATKISNNLPVLSQIPIQINSFVQSPQWSNSTRTPDQHQGRAQNAQIQISFGESRKSALAARGQQMPTNNQSPSNDGSTRTNYKGNKAGSSTCTLQSQQIENSAGTGQKSSPVCGRNVPSVLSTCPSHLSELK